MPCTLYIYALYTVYLCPVHCIFMPCALYIYALCTVYLCPVHCIFDEVLTLSWYKLYCAIISRKMANTRRNMEHSLYVEILRNIF
jgi:hypothetical protein